MADIFDQLAADEPKTDIFDQIANEPGFLESLGQGFHRGVKTVGTAKDVLFTEAGVQSPQRTAANIARRAEETAKIPGSVGLREFQESTGALDALGTLARNPGVIGELTAESLPISGATLVAGAGGGLIGGVPGAAIGAGTVSGTTEYLLALQDQLAEEGVDLQDEERVAKLISDPEFRSRWREKGVKRGAPIGAFDGVMMGVAGGFIGPVRQAAKESGKRMIGAQLRALAKETGVQVAGGMGGEATAQLATGGIDSPQSIIAEGAAEIPFSIAEAVTGVKIRNRARSGAAAAQAAESAGMPATASEIVNQTISEIQDEATGVSTTEEQPAQQTTGETLDELITEEPAIPASPPDVAGVTTTEEVVPHNFKVTDAQDVEDVISGNKPIALAPKGIPENEQAVSNARSAGLTIEETDGGYIVYPAENADSAHRLNELRAWASENLETASPEEVYQYHKEVGTIFGYPENEVEAFAQRERTRRENEPTTSQPEGDRAVQEEAGQETQEEIDPLTNEPTIITGSGRPDRARIAERNREILGRFAVQTLQDAEGRDAQEGSGNALERTISEQALTRALKKIKSGKEATAYESEDGTIYKLFSPDDEFDQVGWTLSFKKQGDEWVVDNSAGTLGDAAVKISDINAIGGVASEIVGISNEGSLIIKQEKVEPIPKGKLDEAREGALRNAKAVSVDAPGFEKVWITISNGEPIAISDLHAGNLAIDSDGEYRILDANTTVVPQRAIDESPAIADAVQRAYQLQQPAAETAQPQTTNAERTEQREGPLGTDLEGQDVEDQGRIQEEVSVEEVTGGGESAPVPTAIKFTNPVGDSIIVSPSAKTTGKWQATLFINGEPSGDAQFNTKEEAIRSAQGEEVPHSNGRSSTPVGSRYFIQQQEGESNAIQESETAESVLGDEGIRREGELPTVGEGNAQEVPSQESVQEEVTKVYREASPYQALPLIDPNTSADLSSQEIFFAESPELALGQGGNKGIRMEFDRSKLDLSPNRRKPGTDIAIETGQPIELIGLNDQKAYQDALVAIEFNPNEISGAEAKRIQRLLPTLGWRKTKSGDVIRYEKPSSNLETEKPSQTITGSNEEMASEMPVQQTASANAIEAAQAEFTRLATRGTGESPAPSEIDKIVARLKVPEADVQDVAQDVAVKAATSYNPESGASPLTWVNRVAQSTVADYFRKQSAQKRSAASTVSMETPVASDEDATIEDTIAAPRESRPDLGAVEVAVEVLDELTEQERTILRSVVMDGDSQADVANRLGISKESVSRIQRGALKKMRQRMTERGVSKDDIGFDENLDFRNFGPGAANVREALVRYEERKFGRRFVDDKTIAEEIRNNFGERYYNPIPNKVTASEAKAYIEENGITQAINAVKHDRAMEYRSRVTMGQILIKRLNQTYKALRDSDPDAARAVLEEATNLSESVANLGTELGQGVQAFAMWSRLTPEGKLLEYQRAVKKSRDRHKKSNEEDIEEIIDTANSEGMSDKEKIAALKALLKKNKVLKQAKDRIQEIIKAAKEGKLGEEDLYNIISDRLGLPTYSPEVAAKIRELSEKIDEAAEGIPKDTAILELAKYMARMKGFAFTDLPMMVFYGNILSGYNTQLVNFLDTLVNINSEISGLALANPKAAMQIFSGMVRGFKEGKADAFLALTQGRMATQEKWMEVPRLGEVAEFGKKGGVPIDTTTPAGKAAKRLAELPAAKFLNLYKYVGRLMSASDSIMARSAKEASAALQAYRMAEQEGLSGNALNQRVQEILAITRMPDFLEQAKREGFKGVEAEARAIELREQFRDELISRESSEFASEATYNHEPHGILGLISKSAETLIAGLAAKSPTAGLVARTILPFTRIVANVTNRGLNYTPWGYKRAFFGYTGEGRLTQDQRNAMLARANIGMTGIVILGSLQALGLIVIHGAGPSDPERRRQMQNAGWKPYSIQIGDTYYNYTYTPLGLMLSIMGNTMDAERYGELGNKDALTRSIYAVSRLGSTIFSQSFLSSLSGLFDALSEDPGKSISGIRGWITRSVGAYTTPNIVRDVQKLYDPTLYSSEGVAEDVIKNTPFASIALNPVLNAFGEPVRPLRQRFISIKNPDPAWKLILDKGLRVPVPSRTTRKNPRGKEILSQKQYYSYLKESGQQLKKWIIANQEVLDQMDPESAQAAIDKAATQIRANVLPRIRAME